ncbi:retrotransposon protein [Cucumis melo var. makuwa]|uniref:Retrotransposon protein n=1 Tax=Cucumis melo var. makuwa TaxID=1194695 RepID=A0A5A7U5Z3_CUCMM|nr:retrotransposon protein [Cucumis melo var. makuwa]TYK23077.1 retrotransposon protein [Cucumis melo var. makuwa]
MPPNKMDMLSVNIATFLTRFVPYFFLPYILRNSGVSNAILEPTPLHRSTRVREPPIHLQDYHCFFTIVFIVEPTSYQEASAYPLWQKAIDDELQALEKLHT